MELSRQLLPTIQPWRVGQAETSYYVNGFGYNLIHPIGSGPDKVEVKLLDWTCENEVTGMESISIENPTYTESANSTFSYGVTMNVGYIHNSSLVDFEVDQYGGASAGDIKFCTRVVTKLERPGQSDLDVQFRSTKISLGFDLRQNFFSLGAAIVIPSSVSCIPANVTLRNVTDPNDSSVVDDMITSVECGFEKALEPFAASVLPQHFSVEFNVTRASFLSPPPGMKNELDVCIRYPCLNPSVCASVNNNIIPDFIGPLFTETQSKISDNTVQQEIANCDTNATGIDYSDPGPLEFATAGNITVPVVTQTPAILQGSLIIPTNVTIDNVIPAQNSSIETAMFDIVITAIDNCLQPFASSTLNNEDMSFSLIKLQTLFSAGDMHNEFQTKIMYTCTSTQQCTDSVYIEDEVEPFLQQLLDNLENQLANGKISNDIITLANAQGITNFNGMPANITNELEYPLEPAPDPVITNSTVIGFTRSVALTANTTITGVVQPITDLERSIMNNTVEIGFSRGLMNYTGSLPDGMDLIVDLTDSDFFQPSSRRLIRSLQSSNVVEFKFTLVFHCSDNSTCDTLEDSMPTVFSGLIATVDNLLQNGRMISYVQEVASEKGLPNFNSMLTNSGLSYPTTLASQRRLQTTVPLLETGQIVGLSSYISLQVNVTINNVTSPNNATHEDDMVSVVEKAVESCLFNFTYALPIGYDLVVTSPDDPIFDNSTKTMLNCFDVRIIYPCLSVDDCIITSNTAENEMYRMVIDIRAKATDGRLASEVINQAQEDNVPGFASSSTEQVVYPSKLGSDLKYEWGDPIVTREFSVLAATLCIANFTAPSSVSEELQMESAVEMAVTQILTVLIVNLPSGVTFAVEVPSSNITSTQITNQIDFKFEFDCDSDPLTTAPECETQHSAILQDHVPSLINKVLTAIDDGSLASSLRSYASTNNAPGYLFAEIPDGCFIYPSVTVLAPALGNFIGISVDAITINIFTQFSVDACQCDDFNLVCIVPPNAISQNEVFSICIYPNSDDVDITNLEMTITGDDNGYEYSPVSYGASTYVATPPISSAFQISDKVLVKTYLVGGFYNLNGGTSSVSVSGNAMLEFDSTKNGRKLDTSTSGFKLQMDLARDEEIVDDDGPSSRITICLLKLYELVQRFMRSLGF